jgi:glycogen operon protein
MHDLVRYERKHNEANGDDNRDGESHNHSWNGGHEGPSEDPAIEARRERQVRSLLATLLLSQGVPMLCGGDEIGRTQAGNNNGYCQDNELSWTDWQLGETRQDLLAFVRRLIALRLENPVFTRRRFFQGRPIRGAGVKDIAWLAPSGEEMDDRAWSAEFVRCLGMMLSGDLVDEVDERGEKISGDTMLVLFNAGHEPMPFVLPPERSWTRVLDTAHPDAAEADGPGPYALEAHAVAVLRARPIKAREAGSADRTRSNGPR